MKATKIKMLTKELKMLKAQYKELIDADMEMVASVIEIQIFCLEQEIGRNVRA